MVVERRRIELPTSRVRFWRSPKLSYRPTFCPSMLRRSGEDGKSEPIIPSRLRSGAESRLRDANARRAVGRFVKFAAVLRFAGHRTPNAALNA